MAKNMKNLFNKTNVALGTAFAVLVFGLSMAAFPAEAQAQYQYHYEAPVLPYCSYPQVASVAPNGYYYCNYPNQVQTQAPVVYNNYPTYTPPVYNQPTYQSLTATCSALNSSVQTGSSVQWQAYASGGNGSYSYTWTGNDGLYGNGQTVSFSYYSQGMKTATVTVYSNGQSVTANCSSTVNVYQQNYGYNYNYNYTQPYYNNNYSYNQVPVYASNNTGLDIGCFADPANAAPNQPVTWSVEVTGGIAPYTYSWTGSDSLAGTQSSVTKYYETTGEKSAIVSVTSADGRAGTKACSNALAIRRTTTTLASAAPVQSPAVQNQGNPLGAASYFSLNNVPWGWVAVLIILVLGGTVMYLLFNRPKI